MAASHISVSELPTEMQHLVERAVRGELIVIDSERGSVRLTTSPVARSVEEILNDPTITWSDAGADDKFASDLEEIMAENRRFDRDVWAE